MIEAVPAPAYWMVGGGLFTTLAALLALLIRRTYYRDSTGIKGDQSEATQFLRLEAEIKRQSDRADRAEARADIAFKERNDAIEREAKAVSAIGKLEAQVEALSRELESVKKTLQQFTSSLGGKPQVRQQF